MIPGMTRRMAEHRGGLAELEHHRNSVEAPLLKTGNGNGTSFGHHVLTNEDTLYSLEATRGSIVTSQSVNSVIGMSSSHIGSHLKRNVPEGAEIMPAVDIERRSPMASTMSRLQHLQQQQQQQQHQSFLYNNSPTIQSSTTLPILVSKQQQQSNNHHHHHQYYQQQQQYQQQQRHYVTNGLSEDVEMDRTSFMNGDDEDDCDEQDHSASHQHHSLVKVVVPPPPRLDFVLPGNF